MRLVIASILVLAAPGCGGDSSARFCFGSEAFCRRFFGPNEAPLADAGDDPEVVEGDRVELDGTGSEDSDGIVEAYAWTQRSGPPVALENADTARAGFTAPAVAETTTLEFRLLVTDDDGASDSDSVRVTVRTRRAAAVATGIELLKGDLVPDPVTATDSFVGLWLGARVTAVAGGWDPELDRLLDELRVVEILRPPPAGPAGAEASPHELGQREVAAFAATRDPATAELALAAARSAEPTSPRLWRQAIVAQGYPFARNSDSRDALEAAAEALLLDHRHRASPATAPAATPEALAAATLLLTVAAPAAPDPR